MGKEQLNIRIPATLLERFAAKVDATEGATRTSVIIELIRDWTDGKSGSVDHEIS